MTDRLIQPAEEHKKSRDADREREVAFERQTVYFQRTEQRAHSADDHEIENVRPDDIAYREFIFAGDGSADADRSFGQARTHSNDSHADDERRDLEHFRSSGASVDEEVGTFYQQEESADEQ